MAKKRSDDDVRPAVPGLQTTLLPEDSEGEQQMPALLDCLLPRWRDGKCVRRSGTISVKIVGCYFVASLTCPSEGLQCSVSSLSIVGLLEALNATAASASTVWTPTFERQKRDRQHADKQL